MHRGTGSGDWGHEDSGTYLLSLGGIHMCSFSGLADSRFRNRYETQALACD